MKMSKMTTIITSDNCELSEVNKYKQKLVETAANLVNNSLTDNTRKSYQSDFRLYQSICRELMIDPFDEKSIIYYIAEETKNGKKHSTISRRITAVKKIFGIKNIKLSPAVDLQIKKMMVGLKKSTNYIPCQKEPFLVQDIKKMIDLMDLETLEGSRDKALILLGFVTGSRRGEIVSLDVSNIEFCKEGMVVTFPKTKINLDVKKAVHFLKNKKYCPVLAMKNWLTISGIISGPVFRGLRKGKQKIRNSRLCDRSIADIVKYYAQSIGKDIADFSGHSLRRGFATAADRHGAKRSDIKNMGDWSGDKMLNHYIESNHLFDNMVSAQLGL